ncbi:Cytochrome BC1 synthesis, putative [Theobroma cacao]|uniref:Cytochrome BC1 synthesis, putative n=1 Tax=Theobroma cacao TaxID=3641 RepID=A0A061G8X9_THECC|nr:Cytochrome BC1 synthesis, putative [Theobroma cacao]
MSSHQKVIKARSLLSTAASIAATAMLIRTIANDFIPADVQNYFSVSLQNLSRHFSSQLTIVIEEFRGLSINQVFEAADVYLGSKTTPSIQRLKVGKSEKENKLALSMDRGEVLVDVYENVEMKWKLFVRELNQYAFGTQTRVILMDLCAPNDIQDTRYGFGAEKGSDGGSGKLYQRGTILQKSWESLETWYLLYGPPGTGKSSLIAAMANHLKYNIYDLDLTAIQTNSDLRFLLLAMPSRSILVVEDIECSIELENRESENEPRRRRFNGGDNQVTLSGLLNFIDGLWSCCGEERIIIFTTNHKERLDPALLRPGRMDMHIHMSYCNASVFKQLAFNYLGICDHQLFQQLEKLLEEVDVTPAEVAGELMKNSNREAAFHGLVKFLYEKISERDTKQENGNKNEQEDE